MISQISKLNMMENDFHSKQQQQNKVSTENIQKERTVNKDNLSVFTYQQGFRIKKVHLKLF